MAEVAGMDWKEVDVGAREGAKWEDACIEPFGRCETLSETLRVFVDAVCLE